VKTGACLALLTALLPGIAGAEAAADARAAARLEAALQSLSSLRADFLQTVTDAQGQQVESASGRVSLARPGRFRWDYREPPQVIVSDGTTVWFYDADLAQVTIRSAAETVVGTPAMLLSGDGELRAEFDIADGGDSEGLAWTRLTPRTAEGDFREMRVGLSGDAIREMILVDRLGQTTRLEFDHVERNPAFDPSTFRFTPPPGVDVVGRAPVAGP
jgi:outer membrane lipoprotein carrier protein